MQYSCSIIASFSRPFMIIRAVERIRCDYNLCNWDVLTTCPIHKLDTAMHISRSLIPIITFCSGMTGFVLGMVITFYMNSFDYALLVGGRPLWSLALTFPIVYEIATLFSVVGTVIGMLLINKLPCFYHPIFNCKTFCKLKNDNFLLIINFNKCNAGVINNITKTLNGLGSNDINLIYEWC